MKEQKVALVTGVSSGIGRATATALAGAGFRAFGTMRDATKVSQESRTVELVPLDVRDAGSIRTAVKTVLERAGRIGQSPTADSTISQYESSEGWLPGNRGFG